MNLPNPNSPQWAEYLSAAFRKVRMRAQPDPYADAHLYAGAIPDCLPTRAMPMRPDDELIPGRDDLESDDE